MNPQSEDEKEEDPHNHVAALCIATSYLPFHSFSPLPESIEHCEETYLCGVVSSTCSQFTNKKMLISGEETEILDER